MFTQFEGKSQCQAKVGGGKKGSGQREGGHLPPSEDQRRRMYTVPDERQGKQRCHKTRNISFHDNRLDNPSQNVY